MKKILFIASSFAIASAVHAAAPQAIATNFGVVSYKIDPAHKADAKILINGKDAKLAEGDLAVATEIHLAKGTVGTADYVLISAKGTDEQCKYTTFALSSNKGPATISEGAQLCGLPEQIAAKGNALSFVIDGKPHAYADGQIK